VLRFNAYDLYSRSERAPAWPDLRPFYEDQVAAFLPGELWW
jgi:inositol oxygenase